VGGGCVAGAVGGPLGAPQVPPGRTKLSVRRAPPWPSFCVQIIFVGLGPLGGSPGGPFVAGGLGCRRRRVGPPLSSV